MKQESLASTTPPRRTPLCGNNTSSTYLGTILVFGWVNPSSGKLEKPAFAINYISAAEWEDMCA